MNAQLMAEIFDPQRATADQKVRMTARPPSV